MQHPYQANLITDSHWLQRILSTWILTQSVQKGKKRCENDSENYISEVVLPLGTDTDAFTLLHSGFQWIKAKHSHLLKHSAKWVILRNRLEVETDSQWSTLINMFLHIIHLIWQ